MEVGRTGLFLPVHWLTGSPELGVRWGTRSTRRSATAVAAMCDTETGEVGRGKGRDHGDDVRQEGLREEAGKRREKGPENKEE